MTSVALASSSFAWPQTSFTVRNKLNPAYGRVETPSFLRSDMRSRAEQEQSSWRSAEIHLGELFDLQPNWDSYGGQPPASETIFYAAAELTALRATQLPAPRISPSGDGQVLASWSIAGIEIELWFEGPYQETLLVEDEEAELGPYAGPDPLLFNTTRALRTAQSRT